MKKETQGRDLRWKLLAAIAEAKRERPDQVGLRPVPAGKTAGKPTAASPDDETERKDARP
jgi:hypothetical protein